MYINKFKMTTFIDLLFTQECLNKLEELFYTTFYCNTYIGYENVLTELSKTINMSGNGDSFKDVSLQETLDTYLLITEQHYMIGNNDDNVMKEIIFHSVLILFVDIIIIPSNIVFDSNLKILHTQFILPITGNINIKRFIQNNYEKITKIYGEVSNYNTYYGHNEYNKYFKDELLTYLEFNSQGSILK